MNTGAADGSPGYGVGCGDGCGVGWGVGSGDGSGVGSAVGCGVGWGVGWEVMQAAAPSPLYVSTGQSLQSPTSSCKAGSFPVSMRNLPAGHMPQEAPPGDAV